MNNYQPPRLTLRFFRWFCHPDFREDITNLKLLAVTTLMFFLTTFSNAQQKKMCVTVDDLPVVSYGINEPAFLLDVTRNLIATFDKYDIPAIGYVNEQKLYINGQLDSARVSLLALWLDNGYDLGNHTYSHKNYDKTPFNEFTADILKGEKVTKSLCEQNNKSLNYFRHPYLRAGKTKGAYDSLNQFLNQNGYQVAPVTIDNDDYLFAVAYHRAFQKGDTDLMQKIGKSYIEYMERKLLYFEALSEHLFGRNISQTLIIHANLLNAHYLDELAEMYLSHGYDFISQAEVLEDEAYREPITKFGDWGISWIERWIISQGKQGDLFKDDPPTPEYIKELSR